MKKYDYLPDMVVIEGPLAGGHLGFTKEQLQELDQSAVIGVKYSSYNVEAVVLRDQIPEGFKVHPISIEDLFIFMIKGVH